MKYFLLLPILIIIFILDRFCLAFFIWHPSDKFQTWIYKDNYILSSIIRVIIGTIIIFILNYFFVE